MMEKRTNKFEKYTLEKYGAISYTTDFIIVQEKDIISTSSVGIILRKERSNPDKYIIIIGKNSIYNKDIFYKNGYPIDYDEPFVMSLEQLTSLSNIFDKLLADMGIYDPLYNAISCCFKKIFNFITCTIFED